MPSKVHARGAENDVGRSSLINRLAGITQPNSGPLEIDDKLITFPETARSPLQQLLGREQSHNIEAKIEAMIQSVVNNQAAFTKALLEDRQQLATSQAAGDVLAAYRVLRDAFDTDVRPLLAQARIETDRNPDPIAAFRQSGYAEKVAVTRSSVAATSGYPGV